MFKFITIIVGVLMTTLEVTAATFMKEADFNKAVSVATEEICKHEGFRASWYVCPAGKRTIGHGLTGNLWDKPTITVEESKEVVKMQAQVIGKKILLNVHKKLTVNQLASLISFVYNVGFANFKSSTLLKELNKGNYNQIPSELQRWVYAKGKRLSGLVKRRASEAALFVKA